jgi:hypothetical protein
MKSGPRGITARPPIRPFSFIRTVTVGPGIAPDLLTLNGRQAKEALAGSAGLRRTYRRWGISPRPENALRGMRKARKCYSIEQKWEAVANAFSSGAGSPIFTVLPFGAAMAINGHRNKPFGPGGSTRRLHPSGSALPFRDSGPLRRGRNRIDEGVKGALLPGMIPPLSGHFVVANDNYAQVRLAA